jgi:hypothetical protein
MLLKIKEGDFWAAIMLLKPIKSDTPRKAGGLMSGAASKAVTR